MHPKLPLNSDSEESLGDSVAFLHRTGLADPLPRAVRPRYDPVVRTELLLVGNPTDTLISPTVATALKFVLPPVTRNVAVVVPLRTSSPTEARS